MCFFHEIPQICWKNCMVSAIIEADATVSTRPHNVLFIFLIPYKAANI